MITRVTVQNFKRFKDETHFDLKPNELTFLAGGNNSGKSTVLQALAVWEFCRSVVKEERGEKALIQGYNGSGVGLSAEDFTPIGLPDLKHLWPDLKSGRTGQVAGGYNQHIICHWQQPDKTDSTLGFALSLANDRLFVKPCASSLTQAAGIPRMAYLPPFAGILAKEERMSVARQNRMIGQGLAGGVLRNVLYQLEAAYREGLDGLRSSTGRIPGSAKSAFRSSSPWYQLADVLNTIFDVGLSAANFNELYHVTLKVNVYGTRIVNKEIVKRRTAVPRDIMVEGSGFLQWLSVYALAASPEIDVLLLDEPDAHLHPSLQNELIFRLIELLKNEDLTRRRKQALVATHSTTVLSEALPTSIYRMDADNKGYLVEDIDRIGLFIGLGSQYAPKIDHLKKCKRLLMYEGYLDITLLQIWSAKLGYAWPDRLVAWKQDCIVKNRQIFHQKLKDVINGLQTLSIVDLDRNPPGKIDAQLHIKGSNLFDEHGFGSRMWKRTNIENYLLVPEAIARAAHCNVTDIVDALAEHGVVVPPNYLAHNCATGLMTADGKLALISDPNSVGRRFGINQVAIANAMEPDEIAEDVKMLLKQIQDLCVQP